ncbi:hypothetical protein MM26B8_02780 [Mycoplasmopsis meleagridis]|uniref:Uncharacterized protein n=1 Tax=Mycoplasmopsis meleagridis ATCC 25294 TaxID=1264554 RepID=A0A0F5H123_9BACT|nr:hypothetical protein [Mycoplasmopsis meleagridis]KKB27004.1 hypothetical protein MMELEA_03170 [Mycoplasmopsis meleagridis ATCC 25294]OAD18351.1 hypothetical protein MM26B8_02780 [Mycoplasmopsis meleagridis]VEU77481.1 Uncharacterised protein [Mycoplasmopsis meleagridis]
MYYINYLLSDTVFEANVICQKDDKVNLIYEFSLPFDQHLSNLDKVIKTVKNFEKRIKVKKDGQIYHSLIIDESLSNYYMLKNYQAEILAKSNLITKQHKIELEKKVDNSIDKNFIILRADNVFYQTYNKIGELKTYHTFPLNKVANKISVKKNFLLVEKNSLLAKVKELFLANKIYLDLINTNVNSILKADKNNHSQVLFLQMSQKSITLATAINKIVISNKKEIIDLNVAKKVIQNKFAISSWEVDLLIDALLKNYIHYTNKNYFDSLNEKQKFAFEFIESIITEFWNSIEKTIISIANKGYKIVILDESTCTFTHKIKHLKIKFDNFNTSKSYSNLSYCMQGIVKYLNNNEVEINQDNTINNIVIPNKKNFFSKFLKNIFNLNRKA